MCCSKSSFRALQSARSVWRQRGRPGARSSKADVAICTERVEAKISIKSPCSRPFGCNLHGACGGKVWEMAHRRTRQGLQSARSVWRQSWITCLATWVSIVAICTERVEAKVFVVVRADIQAALQSARCVWRQSTSATSLWTAATVAICTGRAEKPNGIIPPTEKNPRKFMQTYCIFIHLGV